MNSLQLCALCGYNPCSVSPTLSLQLYFVLCEGEDNLQLSSFPDMFQNKGVVGGTTVHRARCVHEWLVRSPQGYRPHVCPVRGGGLRKGSGQDVAMLKQKV